MKNLSRFIFIIFLFLIIIPLCILKFSKVDKPQNKGIDISNITKVKVYFQDADSVVDMDLNEYLKGVVAAEMPANFELEALKAQAVAARTYTLLKETNSSNLKEAHNGADICTNPAHCQAYKNSEQLKTMWGILDYYKYYSKISKSVDDTNDMVIIYNKEIIDPLFHSTSGGKTENSEEVFSERLPYLRGVESDGEEASPKFQSKMVLPFNEFKSKFVEFDSTIKLEKNVNNIKILERTESGRVRNMQIGNKILSGKDIRNILSLNSTNFDIKIEKNNVVITTIGYGHGVGMSQYGANYLAKEGKNYIEILKYYYSGVNVVDINDAKASD